VVGTATEEIGGSEEMETHPVVNATATTERAAVRRSDGAGQETSVVLLWFRMDPPFADKVRRQPVKGG
jgi:hypothetical protein